ncbi:hypothetical protein VCRA2128O305_20266 [Vibrio crassostreae]|uniref:hypothetical protein n=1 Tax=Vibrio crassostreae TaxID=246167 RepID=UPI0005DD1F95|nr:hypothetical protein [Vibrio crassostreae]TCT64284.1 hypothetical protein EDB44_105114 [Vibrio crassostreae]TCT84520.1 hypothetical protein EDB43_105114 [Vibrio crassostreae]TCU05817.1 hypothetical protein EDB47_105211 [Vibrio crassostreae]TDW12984.1 hypothetical protein EDB45_102341 [Vibrio crassostreae]CAK1848606.1 hypothetical protein VCRA2110O173_10255 [Vibrio crassostreae]
MSDNLLHTMDEIPSQTHEHLYWYIDESKQVSDAIIESTKEGILGIRFRICSDGGVSPYEAMRKLAKQYVSECHYHNRNLYVGKPRQIYSSPDLSIKRIIRILDTIDIIRRDLIEGVGYLDIPMNYKARTSPSEPYRHIDISHIIDPKPFFNRPKDFYLFCVTWISSISLFYQGVANFNFVAGCSVGCLCQLALKKLLGYKMATEEEKQN